MALEKLVEPFHGNSTSCLAARKLVALKQCAPDMALTEITGFPKIRGRDIKDLGFPKIRGTFLGVPIIRTLVYRGLYWGPPI